MARPLDTTTKTESERILRFDAGHSARSRGAAPALHQRRVRQVLAGAAVAHGSRTVDAVETASESGKLRAVAPAVETSAASAGGRVLRRFRDNYHTLSHLARDPLVWCIEEGGVLSDLREALWLTESALMQLAATGRNRTESLDPPESVLSIANVVEQRVDRLFDRMEQLTTLRQLMYRMSAILEGVPRGVAPRLDELDSAAETIVDLARRDPELATLLSIESADRPTRIAAHVVNVAGVSARLALGVPEWREECALAVSAALLQDVGMMRVPSDVLDSPDPLTAPQRILIQQHPAVSAAFIQQIKGHDPRLVAAVLQHHERLDGSGYPDRKSGEAVDAVARLLGVADAYVGMQSPRPYRPALSAEQAMHAIAEAALAGRLDKSWVSRLPVEPPRWLRIPTEPEPPSYAPAVSALAA
jgi:HD-GYP domain-containing protein (c-di-GMP phosphodiesterase class II)